MDRDQLEKSRRETLRWRILQTLNIGRPLPVSEDILLQTVGGADMPITQHDLRRELDYLRGRELVEITGQGTPQWHGSLTRYGADLAEYTIECQPGIARPVKYW